MHDLADIEHGIEDDWVIGGLLLPLEEGIGDGLASLHLQGVLLQEVHKGEEPVHGKQITEVVHVGQDLADDGEQLHRGVWGGGGKREGRGRYSILYQRTLSYQHRNTHSTVYEQHW